MLINLTLILLICISQIHTFRIPADYEAEQNRKLQSTSDTKQYAGRMVKHGGGRLPEKAELDTYMQFFIKMTPKGSTMSIEAFVNSKQDYLLEINLDFANFQTDGSMNATLCNPSYSSERKQVQANCDTLDTTR